MKKFLLLAALLPFHCLFCQTPAFVRDSLENYIRQGMKDWQIPGLSIVIVKDGQVVWMKGYGVKRHPQPGAGYPWYPFYDSQQYQALYCNQPGPAGL